MAVPPLAGWWADSRWGTDPWLLIVGAGFGFLSGMLAILKLSSSFEKPGGTLLPSDAPESSSSSGNPSSNSDSQP